MTHPQPTGSVPAGTLLNVATVLIGTTIGVLAGARVPERLLLPALVLAPIFVWSAQFVRGLNAA